MPIRPPAGPVQPVLIAGAGPVGLTAALELARFGVPSTVLEKADGLRCTGSRGIVLQRATLEVFERVRALEILERGLVPDRRLTFFGDTELFRSDFPRPGEGELPLFVNLQQDHTERILLEAAQKQRDLIDIRWGNEIVGVDQDASGVSVLVHGAKAERRFASEFLLACDGRRSPIRKLLGADFPGYTDTSSFLIADVRGDLSEKKEHRFTFAPANGQGQTQLIVPQPDGIWRVDWQLFPGQDPSGEMEQASLEARLRSTLGEDARYTTVWCSAYKFHQRIMESMLHGRVLFAGDSAHLVAPFGARGMNSGIQDAENAAWKVAAVVHRKAPRKLVDSYQAERHAAGMHNQEITRATMAFISPQTAEAQEERDAILRASVHDPRQRPRVDSGKMSAPFTYADSPIVTGAHPLKGSRIPDIALPGGKRLRHRIGAKPLVLAFDQRPSVHAGADVVPMSLDAQTLAAFGVVPGDYVIVRPDGHVGGVVPADRVSDALTTSYNLNA